MSYDPNQPSGPQGQPQWGQPPYGQPQQPPYGQPGYNPTQPVYNPTQPGYNPEQYREYGQYGAPPQGYMPPPQPQQQKKSLRWLWITLGIIGGIVVLGCAACGITAALGVGFFAKVAGPTLAATEYYQAIKTQDYNKAFSYWDVNNASVEGQQVTQQAFVTAAQLVDTTKGPVSNFSVQPDTNNPSQVTVVVTRNGTTYDVLLQLQQVNGTWKIVKANNI